jgi:hydroxypyruvate reductase
MPSAIDLLNLVTVEAPGLDEALAARFRVHKQAVADVHGDALQARAIVTTSGASAELMERMPKLEIVCALGVGYDSIDVTQAAARGIAVTNTPGVLTQDVAELAIALMVMASRRLGAADRLVRAGGWTVKDPIFGHSTAGKRLGILGLGRIGHAIAEQAVSMDMTVAYTNRRPAEAPYRFVPDVLTLARESDVLVLAASAGPTTTRIVNREVLEALGPDGLLINIARGSMVDETALVDVLSTGKLGGAGLDAFAHEPKVPDTLLAMDNVVVTPHIGSGTWEARSEMAHTVLANLDAHFAGKPLVTEVPETSALRKAL